jgi:hypothetical protein
VRIRWGLGLPGPWVLTGGRRSGSSRGSALVGLFKLLGFCFLAALILVAIEVALVVGLILLVASLMSLIGYGIGKGLERRRLNNWATNNWAESQAYYRSQRGR